MSEEPKDPTPPQAAADKPASDAPGEPLKGEVSRTDSPGAGVSAAPTAVPAESPAPKKEPTAKTQAATTGSVPVKVSQQDKMRLCAKDAKGKKGPERKAFMKTCLSTKKA